MNTKDGFKNKEKLKNIFRNFFGGYEGKESSPLFKISNLGKTWEEEGVLFYEKIISGPFAPYSLKSFSSMKLDSKKKLSEVKFRYKNIYKVKLMVSDKFIAFSPDNKLVNDVHKVWAGKYPCPVVVAK